MIDIVTAENRHLFENQLEQMWRQRYEVFVKKMGWDLPAKDGREIDDYDHEDTVYLLTTEDGETVLGSQRLIPTTSRHLMGDLFADMCEGQVPCGPEIWESSRGHVYAPNHSEAAQARFGVENLCAMAEFGLLTGITKVSFVMAPYVVPSLISMGWDVTPLGAPTEYLDGKKYLACYIGITPSALQNIRAKHDISGSVIRYLRVPTAA